MEIPSIGDVVRNKRQPFLAGPVTHCKFSLFEVRLDTGNLTMWSYNEYEPIVLHYYKDAQQQLYRLDIDPDTLQIVGCWIKIKGHWERAPQGTAVALEFSGDYELVGA